MKYTSQKVAYPYFILATLLFGLQVIFGMLTAAKYAWNYDPLMNILPFNMSREIHINLLIVWLLFGFMGGTYYMIPEESETELYSTKLAYVQFWLFAIIGVTAVVGYLFGWTWGMPFTEQPFIIKVGIVVVALMFLYNILMTVIKSHKWTTIQGVLIAGLVTLAVMFLFGMFFMKNLSIQYFFWWWVIHLWVEGAWELIAAALMAFVMMKLTNVDRTVVEKWLYIEVGLVLFTGITGTGHHYYWIGTPSYWLWFGAIFSAFEPLPILFMVIDTLRMAREKHLEIKNRLAMDLAVGSTIIHFFGAGVWGFAQTLPQINKWTHGTQITASHGHFAFFGAYVMLVMTLVYFMVPQLKNLKNYNQTKGFVVFFTTVLFMILMVLSLAIAGIVQVYFQRVLGFDYLTAQSYMHLWYQVLLVSGVCLSLGVFLYVYDVLTLKEQ
ncbi:MAG: cbb3-type cytochrome c oxidase subunit I [Deltaproteobacteria bacterium]|nr:cbb3-type cytochrome c oxidase subunit I [Deltaproteobacteria bacterium]MCL5277371.1 cbb3-type cytochrome c oxidase subunit I [Deltaproteobacteria bacterium]